jgi:hypothetical protein
MNQICISSDVQSDYMIVGREDFPYVESINFTLLDEEIPFLQLWGFTLMELKDAAEKIIEDVLPTAIANGNGNTEVEYKAHVYKLDFRDKQGFSACAMVNLYNILLKAIEKVGSVYIFTRDAFLKHKRADILAFLRFKQGLRIEDLETEMNAMWQRSSSSRDQVIDSEALRLGLDYLERIGMVSLNRIKKEYQITSRGYLYR